MNWKNWKKRNGKNMLYYFDWNKDGITNWWEYFIPISLILLVEIIAEFLAQWIIG